MSGWRRAPCRRQPGLTSLRLHAAQSSLQVAAGPHVPASSRCSVLPAGGSRASRPRVFTLLSAPCRRQLGLTSPCLHAAQCLAPGNVPPGGQGSDGPTDVRSEHDAEAEPQSPGPRPRLFILRSESRLHCELLGTRTHPALSWVSRGSWPRASTHSGIQKMTKTLIKGRKAVFPFPVMDKACQLPMTEHSKGLKHQSAAKT